MSERREETRRGAALFLLVGLLCLVPGGTRAGTGWYLLMPPVYSGKGDRPYVARSTTLTEWDHVGSYDTAKAREEARAHSKKAASMKYEAQLNRQRGDKALGDGGEAFTFWRAAGDSRCIASEDPRLK